MIPPANTDTTTRSAKLWPSSCPRCGRPRFYANKRDVKRGALRACAKCWAKGRKQEMTPARLAAIENLKAEGTAASRRRVLTPAQRAHLRSVSPPAPALGMKHSAEARARIAAGNRGKQRTPETRLKMRAARYLRLGIEPRPSALGLGELNRWAREVIKRDHGTCQLCGFVKRKRGDMQAHHILSKSRHPEFGLSLDNGVTLCRPCHRDEHRINGLV